jgi:hypothetical protein
MQTNAGIAGALGLNVPRLTLVPARCAVGISQSGVGFRVVHTMSGRESGIVAKVIGAGWCFVCPQGCNARAASDDEVNVWDGISDADFPTANAAATALDAHVLDHKLSAIRERFALAADAPTPPWPPVQLSAAMAALASAEAEDARRDAADAAARRARAAGGEVA